MPSKKCSGPPRTQPDGRIARDNSAEYHQTIMTEVWVHLTYPPCHMHLLAKLCSQHKHLSLHVSPSADTRASTKGSGGKESSKDRRSCVRHAGVLRLADVHDLPDAPSSVVEPSGPNQRPSPLKQYHRSSWDRASNA